MAVNRVIQQWMGKNEVISVCKMNDMLIVNYAGQPALRTNSAVDWDLGALSGQIGAPASRLREPPWGELNFGAQCLAPENGVAIHPFWTLGPIKICGSYFGTQSSINEKRHQECVQVCWNTLRHVRTEMFQNHSNLAVRESPTKEIRKKAERFKWKFDEEITVFVSRWCTVRAAICARRGKRTEWPHKWIHAPHICRLRRGENVLTAARTQMDFIRLFPVNFSSENLAKKLVAFSPQKRKVPLIKHSTANKWKSVKNKNWIVETVGAILNE